MEGTAVACRGSGRHQLGWPSNWASLLITQCTCMRSFPSSSVLTCRSCTSCAAILQTLVHVLAALALMGLGCLWLLMNLSAEFAHARRDMRELPGRSPTALTRDVLTAIQEAPYTGTSPKKGVVGNTKAAATRDQVCWHVAGV